MKKDNGSEEEMVGQKLEPIRLNVLLEMVHLHPSMVVDKDGLLLGHRKEEFIVEPSRLSHEHD